MKHWRFQAPISQYVLRICNALISNSEKCGPGFHHSNQWFGLPLEAEKYDFAPVQIFVKYFSLPSIHRYFFSLLEILVGWDYHNQMWWCNFDGKIMTMIVDADSLSLLSKWLWLLKYHSTKLYCWAGCWFVNTVEPIPGTTIPLGHNYLIR